MKIKKWISLFLLIALCLELISGAFAAEKSAIEDIIPTDEIDSLWQYFHPSKTSKPTATPKPKTTPKPTATPQPQYVSLVSDCTGSGWAQWDKVSGDKLKIRFKLYNISSYWNIYAVQLYVYAVDIWGDKIYDTTIYYDTTKKTIKPEGEIYSDYLTIPNRSDIDTVYCGIKKYSYGQSDCKYTVEFSDVQYYCWTITF